MQSSPPDRSKIGAAEHGVTLADGRRGQRLTDVLCTPLVARVRPQRSVLDERLLTLDDAHVYVGVAYERYCGLDRTAAGFTLCQVGCTVGEILVAAAV